MSEVKSEIDKSRRYHLAKRLRDAEYKRSGFDRVNGTEMYWHYSRMVIKYGQTNN